MSREIHPQTPSRWSVVADALPLTLLLLLALVQLLGGRGGDAGQPAPLAVASVGELQELLQAQEYAWPPQAVVPRLRVERLPADIAELTVEERKAVFFSTLAPLVLAENERIRDQRTRVERLLARERLSPAARVELATLAARYRVDGDLADPAVAERLLRRLDEIPLGLALAQAAKESGWGTSRFAQEGNNLFGVWTWDASQGMAPRQRREGSRHMVRVFPDLEASVRNYIFTLNTGAAYRHLRSQRAQLRAAGAPLDSLTLAEGLERYSERGAIYVRELRWLIRSNGLHELDQLQLVAREVDAGLLSCCRRE